MVSLGGHLDTATTQVEHRAVRQQHKMNLLASAVLRHPCRRCGRNRGASAAAFKGLHVKTSLSGV